MADLDATLEWAVKKYGLPSRVVDRLEERGAKLRNKDELLEWAVEKYGLPSRAVDWLEKRGAKLKNKDVFLERLCLLYEPTDDMIDWAMGKSDTSFYNLRGLFGDRAHKVDWLLRRGARVHSVAIRLLFWHKRYGDGDELKTCAQECSRADLEYVLMSQGARLTPRVVFELLSNPVVQIEGDDGTVMDAPEALLRLRSSWFKAALRWPWPVEKRTINMLEVEAEDMEFIIHYLGRHPDDVDWSLLRSSLSDMADLADEYAIIDLHEILQRDL